jgi:hypothetical protein
MADRQAQFLLVLHAVSVDRETRGQIVGCNETIITRDAITSDLIEDERMAMQRRYEASGRNVLAVTHAVVPID